MLGFGLHASRSIDRTMWLGPFGPKSEVLSTVFVAI